MDIKLHIEGYHQAKAILEQLPVTVQRRMFITALRAGSRPMVRSARQYAPVKGGLLQKSIRAVRGKANRRTETSILIKPVFEIYRKSGKVNAFYGHMQHFGTKERETRKPVITKMSGRYVNLGKKRGKVSPNPFLTKAYTENRDRMVEGFGDYMAKAINDFARKNFKPVR